MFTIIRWVRGFLKKNSEDHLGAYASQAAYFIVLSALPFCIFLLTLLRYSPLTYEDLIDILQMLSPKMANDIIRTILIQVYEYSSIAITSVTIIFVLWSAGRGILAITRGINEIYHIHETRNYIHLRLISAIYTLGLAVALIVTLGLLVFGNIIYRKIIEFLPFLHDIAAFVISMRMLIIFCLLTLLFIFIYKVLPNKKTKLLHVLPGAIGSSLGWMITSVIFSMYFSLSHSFSYMYGSLAGAMMIMLWLYACMYELFLGAELNNMLHPESISGDTVEDIFYS
ncbi:MAG: YihY/virulence factor BrkB family protein [Coprococcus sp.]